MQSAWEIREKETSTDGSLIFQTLECYTSDIMNEETEREEFKIYTFGVNDKGKPVTLQINGFHPFFFIEIPSSWDSI